MTFLKSICFQNAFILWYVTYNFETITTYLELILQVNNMYFSGGKFIMFDLLSTILTPETVEHNMLFHLLAFPLKTKHVNPISQMNITFCVNPVGQMSITHIFTCQFANTRLHVFLNFTLTSSISKSNWLDKHEVHFH